MYRYVPNQYARKTYNLKDAYYEATSAVRAVMQAMGSQWTDYGVAFEEPGIGEAETVDVIVNQSKTDPTRNFVIPRPEAIGRVFNMGD
jgi:hypothetical protein